MSPGQTLALVSDRFKVEWSAANEDDTLRLYVSEGDPHSGIWNDIHIGTAHGEDGSRYIGKDTRIDREVEQGRLVEALGWILHAVEAAVDSGGSVAEAIDDLRLLEAVMA